MSTVARVGFAAVVPERHSDREQGRVMATVGNAAFVENDVGWDVFDVILDELLVWEYMAFTSA